jgi:hypothetical protein
MIELSDLTLLYALNNIPKIDTKIQWNSVDYRMIFIEIFQLYLAIA